MPRSVAACAQMSCVQGMCPGQDVASHLTWEFLHHAPAASVCFSSKPQEESPRLLWQAVQLLTPPKRQDGQPLQGQRPGWEQVIRALRLHAQVQTTLKQQLPRTQATLAFHVCQSFTLSLCAEPGETRLKTPCRYTEFSENICNTTAGTVLATLQPARAYLHSCR